MQNNADRLAISSVVAGVPIVVSGILALGKTIHGVVQNCDSNLNDCQQLDAHVYETISLLEHLDSKALRNEEFEVPLENLHFCLEKCWTFLQKFVDTPAVIQMLLSGHYKRKFDRLNSELDQCKQNLEYYMNIVLMASAIHGRQTLTTTIPTILLTDGQHRRKHVAQSPQKQFTPPPKHHMIKNPSSPHGSPRNSRTPQLPPRQSPLSNHHTTKLSFSPQMSRPNRPVPRSNSVTGLVPPLKRNHVGGSRSHLP